MEKVKFFINKQYEQAKKDPLYIRELESQSFGALCFYLQENPNDYDEVAAYWEEMRSKFFDLLLQQRGC